MIALVEGKLLKLQEDSALVKVDSVGYEVLLPGYCIGTLMNEVGKNVSLCTLEYYEGTPGGGNLIPRLVGFMSTSERDFFKKFTSVKGIGIRKGLKCLCMPVADIASAIEQGDEKMLKTMPGVGKRMAQQMIAELQGKLEIFTEGQSLAKVSENKEARPFQVEALEILVAWGEKRNEAAELIELTCDRHPEITTAEELVPLAYRLKQGIEF